MFRFHAVNLFVSNTSGPSIANLYGKIPWVPLFCVSGAALAYEILLLRLFAIIQWHDFAYLVISLALLGHGISGTVIVVWQRQFMRYYAEFFVLNSMLFAMTSCVCFWMAQAVEFNTLEVIWQPQQWWLLAKIYGLLTVPFFFAANCVALTMVRFKHRIPALYGCDLSGAGIGAAALVLSLYHWSPERVLVYLSMLAFLISVVAVLQLLRHYKKRYRGLIVTALLAFVFAMLIVPTSVSELKPLSFKALSKLHLLPEVQIMDERYSPMGVVTVLRSPIIPLRIAAGLSLASTAELPPQLAVFVDGDGPAAINHIGADSPGWYESQRYLGDLSSALPYRVIDADRNNRRMLQIGLDHPSMVQAYTLFNGVINVVEPSDRLRELMQNEYNQFAGWSRLASKITVFPADVRGFLAYSFRNDPSRQYDMITLQMKDALHAGLNTLSPDYRYTVEAFSQYYRHLYPRGILAVTSSLALPPRATLKVLATALQSLREEGVSEPDRHVLLIRSWKTTTLLVAKTPFTEQQINRARIFCKERWFDLVYYAGISSSEVNHFTRLAQPEFFLAAQALINDPQSFIDRYKFAIEPASDDRPYFSRFFKWSAMGELMALRNSGGAGLVDQGYLLLVITLVLAFLFSLLLIPLPLIVSQFFKSVNLSLEAKDSMRVSGNFYANKEMMPVLFYFLCIGLGFMFVEIALIQRFLLFLSHPVISVTVVISVFLIFAGLGSLFCSRYKSGQARVLRRSIALFVGIMLLYLLLVPSLLTVLAGMTLTIRVMVVAGLLAPIAFLMGMPFPLGLSLLVGQYPHWVPWAWGINGCASVISTVLATLLALHFGFIVVILLALLFYGFAALLLFPYEMAKQK